MEKNIFTILCPVVIEVLDSGEYIIVADFYLNRWASCILVTSISKNFNSEHFDKIRFEF